MNETLDLGDTGLTDQSYGNTTLDLATMPIIRNEVSPEVATNRANKYNAGLGDYSPGKDQLKASILNGSESDERLRALHMKQADDQITRANLAKQYMSAKGKDATQEDFALINALTDAELNRAKDNPDTFFEEMFAKHLVSNTHGGTLGEAMQEAPALNQGLLDVQEQLHWQKEIAQKKEEETIARFQKENPFSKALTYVEDFAVPFAAYSSLPGAVPDAQVSGVLPGTLIEDQGTHLLGLSDPTEYSAQLQSAIDKIYDTDPLMAIQFARSLIGFSLSDKYLYNISGLVDFAAVAPIGKLPSLLGKGAATIATASAVKDAVRATGNRTFRSVTTKILSGDVQGAALDEASRKVIDAANVAGGTKVQTLEDMFGELSPMANPAAALGQDPAVLSTELTQRLVNTLEKSSAAALNSIVDHLKVSTGRGESIDTALKEVGFDWNYKYPDMSDHVAGVDLVPSEKTLIGADFARIRLQTKQGLPFKTARGALVYANRWLKPIVGDNEKLAITPYGDNWYITVDKPIDMTSNAVRDIAIPTEHKAPANLWNMMFGWARSPTYLVPERLMKDFYVAAYGNSDFMKHAREVAAPFQALRDKKTMNAFLQKQRVFDSPKTGEPPGRFSNNLSEFGIDWVDHTGRSPTYNETAAYFSYKQMNDLGFGIYKFGLMRDLTRNGIENHHFKFYVPEEWGPRRPLTAQTVMKGEVWPPRTETGPIQAKAIRGGVDGLPWSSEKKNKGVLIFDENSSNIKWRSMRFTNAEKLKKEIGPGYQLLQLTPEGVRQLRSEPGLGSKLTDNHFYYVLAKKYKTSPLTYDLLPYRAGGRIELKDGWFASQARLYHDIHPDTKELQGLKYDGDNNFFHFQHKKQADEAVGAMEEARQMLVQGMKDHDFFGMHELPGAPHLPTDPEYALQELLANNLPESAGGTIQSFKKMFTGWGGIADLHTPFHTRPFNKSIQDYHKIGDTYRGARGEPLPFEDLRDNEDNLFNTVNLRAAMERNDPIHTFSKTGDPELPMFNLRQAEMIDPESTMNRSMASLMRDRFIEPLKWQAAEHFISQYSPVMSTTLAEMRKNPVKYLLNPEYSKGADPVLMASAKQFRMSAVNFLGMKNVFQQRSRWLKQRLGDFIFNKAGDKTFKIIEPHLLSTVSDPTVFFRSAAFMGYLGMFNPAQLFKQSQILALNIGISGPKKAYQGMAAAPFYAALRLSNESPEMIAAAGVRAEKMGFGSAREFEESYRAMRNSGFDTVSGEVPTYDNMFDQKTIRTLAGEFANKSTFFFRGGELVGRLTAWGSAYKWWKELNPKAAFDNAAQSTVLARATLLNADMVNAASAAWQKGFMGIPTQFTNFPTRLAEIFLSKRLTKAEWARSMMTYSLLYGIPVGVAVPTLYPWYDDVREALLEHGYNYDENVLTKGMVDGVLSLAMETITGEKWNIGEAWGPGTRFVKDIVSGDKSAIEVALGATGSQWGGWLETSQPLFMDLVHTLQYGSKWHPVLQSDLEDWARSMSSSSDAAMRAYYAVHLGKYMTKEYGAVDTLTGLEGLWSAFSGTLPQRTSDAFHQIASMETTKKAQDRSRKKYKEYIHRGLQSYADNDFDAGDAYFNAASIEAAAAGFRDDQMPGLLADAVKNDTLAETVDEQFSKNNAARIEQRIRRMKERGK